jgi:hypothetical protein
LGLWQEVFVYLCPAVTAVLATLALAMLNLWDSSIQDFWEAERASLEMTFEFSMSEALLHSLDWGGSEERFHAQRIA